MHEDNSLEGAVEKAPIVKRFVAQALACAGTSVFINDTSTG
jgi:hypothetical protein